MGYAEDAMAELHGYDREKDEPVTGVNSKKPVPLGYGLTFTAMAAHVHRTAKLHGWWDEGDRNFGEVIALIHSEASEALEEWRDGKPAKIYYNAENPSKPEGIVVEMADIVIRVMDWCHQQGLDLEGAILTKMAYNETRPFRHGGKKA